MRFFFKTLFVFILNELRYLRDNGGWGWCYDCGVTIDVYRTRGVKSHDTLYHRYGCANPDGVPCVGCFPLCELCWQRLKTPQARLPYYRALVLGWAWQTPISIDYELEWSNIRAAVLAGK